MDAKNLLKQFDEEFDLKSVSDISNQQSQQENAENTKDNENFADEIQPNASFSGLNDSSHFDMSSFNQERPDSALIPTGSPFSANRPPPTLSDIPNSEKYLDKKSETSTINEEKSFSELTTNSDQNQQQPPKPAPKQFSVPSFSFSSFTQSQIPNSPSTTRSSLPTDTKNILNTINDLKKERVKDTEKIRELLVENARLQARLAILEHTDIKVSELGSKVEQLLQDYIDNEQIRNQQAALITQLRQEIIVLRSRVSAGIPQIQPQSSKPRVTFE